MKIIRFILSHTLLLIFLIAIGMAYHYRAQLFPNKVTQKIDDSVHQLLVLSRLATDESQNEKQEPKPNLNPEFEEAPDVKHKTVEQSGDIDSHTSVAGTGAAEVPVEAESIPLSAQVAMDAALDESLQAAGQIAEEIPGQITEKTTDPATATEVPSSTATESDSTTLMAAAPTKAAEQTSAVSTDKQAVADSHTELIEQARMAYQSGDSDKSIDLYKKLIDLDPDNPNAYGELGNVFYTKGEWKQAGEAYYEAALRLLSTGQSGQVLYLYRVIYGLDPESAEKLRSQMGR